MSDLSASLKRTDRIAVMGLWLGGLVVGSLSISGMLGVVDLPMAANVLLGILAIGLVGLAVFGNAVHRVAAVELLIFWQR